MSDRDQLRDDLAAVGIETGVHYPMPLHLSKPYVHFGYEVGDYPITERACAQVLSLPMYPQLSQEQQELVAARVVDRVDGGSLLSARERTA